MDESPLAGRIVVVTRPAPGTLAERLAAAGATVEHVPLIAVGPPSDGGVALHAALRDLASFEWLVVTSANGAAAVGDAAAHAPTVRVAAVGAATAAALEACTGRAVDLVPDVANSDGLLAAFPPPASRLLLAQANRADDRLASGLRAAGHDVVAVEAYTTLPRHPDDRQLSVLGSADAIVLASGSAVEAWVQTASASSPDGVARTAGAVVTIGQRTADVAAANGLAVAAVAGAPTDEAILSAVVGALAVR